MRSPYARWNPHLSQVDFGQGDIVSTIERDDLPEALVELFNTFQQVAPRAGNLQRFQRDHLTNLHAQLSLYLGHEMADKPNAREANVEVFHRGVFGLRPIRNDAGEPSYLFVAGNQTNDPNRPLEKYVAFEADPYLAGEWVLAMAQQLVRGTYYRDHLKKLYDLAGTVFEQDRMALGAWGYRSGMMGAVHVAAMERARPQWHPAFLEPEAVQSADISASLRNRVFALPSRPVHMSALDYEADLMANGEILAKSRTGLRSEIRRQFISRIEGTNAANVHTFTGNLNNQDEYVAHFAGVVRHFQARSEKFINEMWDGFAQTVVYAYQHMAGNPDLLPPLAEPDVNKMCAQRLSALNAICFQSEQPRVDDTVLTELDNLIDVMWDVAARNCLRRNSLSAIIIGGQDHLTYADLGEQYAGKCFLVPARDYGDRI